QGKPRKGAWPMSPPEETALLACIREAPEDDAPRLVLADWLEDHGRPEHAELIRVQCQLARLPEDDPGRTGLARRERELLEGSAGWLGPVPAQARDWRLERGLLQVRVGAWDDPELDPAGAWRWVMGLRLTGLTPRAIERWHSSPVVARIAS